MAKSKSKKKKGNPNDRQGSSKNFKPTKSAVNPANKVEEVKETSIEEQSVEKVVTPTVVETATPEVIAEENSTLDNSKEESLTKADRKAQRKAIKEAEKLAEAEEKAKAEKSKAKANKPVKEKKRFGQRTKETVSELKKVSWPKFGEVVKKTGVVIAVVLFFGIALFAVDRLFAWLYSLFTAGL